MIDPNYNYIKFNNFPDEYVQQLRFLAEEVLDEGILGDNPTYKDPSENLRFISKNYSHVPFEINGINFFLNFLVTLPNAGMWYTHVDLGRTFALNVPLQVNLEKGYVLVYGGDDHDDKSYPKLGKILDDISEVTPEIEEISRGRYAEKYNIKTDEDFAEYVKSGKIMKIWINATESDFEKIYLDKPMVLNAKIPHSWVNHDDKFRVVASLTAYDDQDKIWEALTPFL